MDSARRRALVGLLLIAPVPSLSVTVFAFVAPGPVGQVAWLIGKAILYGLPAAWLLWVDRQPLSWSPPRRGGFGTGALLGVVISAAIWALYLLVGDRWIEADRLREIGRANGFATPLAYLGISAWVIVVNALMEEYVYRWFVFTRCRALVPPLAAVLLSAAVFTSHHTILLAAYGVAAPLVVLASAGVFVGGCVWSWCYHRFDSIWPGYVSHAVVDVAILAIGWQLLFG